MYSREVVAEVLAANPIEDVIGASLQLQNAGGGRKKALCPFHTEKTPSFTVNVHRQIYHCFGCGKGGDALGFVMEHEGLGFMEALRKLADRGGVRLPELKPGMGDRSEYVRTQLLELGKFAQSLYARLLHDPERGAKGRAYIERRKLSAGIVERFGVGYAPDDWSTLVDAAERRGMARDVLEGSGLCKRGERGGHYDLFRDRLMFPIRDLAGNVVAFGGRDLGGESPAKYINSPETAVYKKSRVLYGLYEARDGIKKAGHALLVEGYIDLLRCFEAGIDNVVAPCGTALTAEQAALIRRYAGEVVVVYDGDAAGIKAALKGAGVLTAAGLSVRALALPGGQDPDDFIRERGGEAFRALAAGAENFVTFYARNSQQRMGTVEGRTEVAHEIFEILLDVDDAVRVDEYLKLAADRLGLNAFACRREFDKVQRRAAEAPRPAARPAESGAAPAAAAAEGGGSFGTDDVNFVAALLAEPRLFQEHRKALGALGGGAGPLAEVLAAMVAGEGQADPRALASAAAQRLYTAGATTELTSNVDLDVIVRKRLNRLNRDALLGEAQAIERDLKAAELARSDPRRLAELLARKVRIELQIERVEV